MPSDEMKCARFSVLSLILAACGPGPAIVTDPANALEPSAEPNSSAKGEASAPLPKKAPLLVATGTLAPPKVLPPFSCASGKEIFIAGETLCIYTDKLSWSAAEQHCEENGGHLATMTSTAESNALREAMGARAKVATFWIGLAEPSEGTWLWSDAKPARFDAWAGGEPNNAGGRENCGEWVVDSGRWNDSDCFLARPFLCESRFPAGRRAARTACEETRFVVGNREYCLYPPATWEIAQKTCSAKNGDLAILDTAEENDALFAAIGPKISVGSPLWIGLTDASVEGRFEFVSQKKLGTPLWRGGEPNNVPDRVEDEDCVEWSPSDGRWNDLGCSQLRPSLCQKP